jgi:hypothetical protein
VNAPTEELCRQTHRRVALDGIGIHAEILEVAAVIADEEPGLIHPRTEEVGPEARTSSDHLPELGLRSNTLEKRQVHNLWNINPRIEHVDRDRQVGHLLWLRKVVDQRLRIIDLMSDDPRESPFQVQ